MYKIIYSIDDENKGQVLGLYITEEDAQHDAIFVPMAIDEDGNPYSLPIDPRVEEATPHDFARRGQGVVIRESHDDLLDRPLPPDDPD